MAAALADTCSSTAVSCGATSHVCDSIVASSSLHTGTGREEDAAEYTAGGGSGVGRAAQTPLIGFNSTRCTPMIGGSSQRKRKAPEVEQRPNNHPLSCVIGGNTDLIAMAAAATATTTATMSTNVNTNTNTNSTNLIVNYLPQNLGQDEVFQLFSKFGKIDSAKLIKDKHTGQSLGYAFVNFNCANEAANALRALNGTKLQNKVIKVSVARPSSDKIKGANLYISNIPKWMRKDQLEQLFGAFGQIITSRILFDSSTGKSKGVGFIRFDQRQEAQLALLCLNGYRPTVPNYITDANSSAKNSNNSCDASNFEEPIVVKFANSPTAMASSLPRIDAMLAAESMGGFGQASLLSIPPHPAGVSVSSASPGSNACFSSAGCPSHVFAGNTVPAAASVTPGAMFGVPTALPPHPSSYQALMLDTVNAAAATASPNPLGMCRMPQYMPAALTAACPAWPSQSLLLSSSSSDLLANAMQDFPPQNLSAMHHQNHQHQPLSIASFSSSTSSNLSFCSSSFSDAVTAISYSAYPAFNSQSHLINTQQFLLKNCLDENYSGPPQCSGQAIAAPLILTPLLQSNLMQSSNVLSASSSSTSSCSSSPPSSTVSIASGSTSSLLSDECGFVVNSSVISSCPPSVTSGLLQTHLQQSSPGIMRQHTIAATPSHTHAPFLMIQPSCSHSHSVPTGFTATATPVALATAMVNQNAAAAAASVTATLFLQHQLKEAGISQHLYVGNLDGDVNEAELEEIFRPYGCVIAINVIKEKKLTDTDNTDNTKIARSQTVVTQSKSAETRSSAKCKGFGFVKMSNEFEAMLAIKHLNGKLLRNKSLQVTFKNPR